MPAFWDRFLKENTQQTVGLRLSCKKNTTRALVKSAGCCTTEVMDHAQEKSEAVDEDRLEEQEKQQQKQQQQQQKEQKEEGSLDANIERLNKKLGDELGEELDLKGLRDKYKDLPAPSVRFAECRQEKETGAAYFKSKDFKEAAECYERAIKVIENEWEFTAMDAREAKELRVVCNSNAAQCYLNLKRYFAARKKCDAALDIDDEHAKTLYRRGIANSNLSAFDSARKDFQRALALNPENKHVKKELKRLDSKVEKHKRKEKRVYEKAFQKLDGVFSENRDTLENYEGMNTFERCFNVLGKIVETYFGHSWPWFCTTMPLIVIVGKVIGRPLGIGSDFSSRIVSSCIFLLGGLFQIRQAQRKKFLLPSWISDSVREWASWASGGISVMLAWSLGLSQSRKELSFVSKVAMAYVLIMSSIGAVKDDATGGDSMQHRALKAGSVLLLLLLLGQHSL